MTQTLTETNELTTVKIEQDTWILALPADLCQREGLPEGTLASLTFKNDAIQASYIRPTARAEQAAARFINKYGDFMKEMEKLAAKNISDIRPPSQKLQEVAQRLLVKNRPLYEELKRLGD